MVLPLQKLIHLRSDSDCESDCPDVEKEVSISNRPKRKKRSQPLTFFKSVFPNAAGTKRPQTASAKPLDPSSKIDNDTSGFASPRLAPTSSSTVSLVRTLQRYHGGPNEERIEFMEKHSALASKNLGVGVEQVSIFLTSCNTVISFFESSAEDIETPLIARLNTQETILRRSSDACMLAQVSFWCADQQFHY